MSYTNLDKYKNWLETNLTKERFEHSIGTAECAYKLAEKFNLDKDKAYLCGLIHDCAKCFPDKTLKSVITNFEGLCSGELINPKTYHAPAGKILAQKEFGIEDKEILDAIRWHTIGKIDMTDFEKIIFIADKTEVRTRPAEMVEAITNQLEKGLDFALLECYKITIKSLLDRNLKICQTTIDIYNNLLNILDPKD